MKKTLIPIFRHSPLVNREDTSCTMVKLIVGLLSNQEKIFLDVRSVLEKKFGPVDLESKVMEFTYTDYYEKELGHNIKRIFVSFNNLLQGEDLFKIKMWSRTIEKRFSEQNRRLVNIDPGYVTYSKLVLFTTKDYSHRVYLNKGIFVEVALKFSGNTFAPYPWTYPDYRTGGYIAFFNRVRERYKQQLREG